MLTLGLRPVTYFPSFIPLGIFWSGQQTRPTSSCSQALHAFGARLCFIDPLWSIAFIVLVQLNFAIARRTPFISRI